jgi:hypothetical protein
MAGLWRRCAVWAAALLAAGMAVSPGEVAALQQGGGAGRDLSCQHQAGRRRRDAHRADRPRIVGSAIEIQRHCRAGVGAPVQRLARESFGVVMDNGLKMRFMRPPSAPTGTDGRPDRALHRYRSRAVAGGRAMLGPPRGTVTFLFTTFRARRGRSARSGDGYAELLAAHSESGARDRFRRGCEIGAGRALFVAFARPPDAVGAAEAARRELVRGARPDGDR